MKRMVKNSLLCCAILPISVFNIPIGKANEINLATDVYSIDSMDDFISYVEEWNLSSEASLGKTYNLNIDLDFADTEYIPISVFSGTLNGNNHTFKNIDLNKSGSCIGLITKYGIIKDLNIDNIDINSDSYSYVGFISKNYGNIENINVSGSITGSSYVGGIVGYNGNYTTSSGLGYGVIKNCTNEAYVDGKINVGGIAGFSGGKIIASNNSGSINDKYYSSNNIIMNIGGICGYLTGEIVDSHNKGIVGHSGTGTDVGGIAGLGDGEIYYCSNEKQVIGKNNIGGIVGLAGVEKNTDEYSEEDLPYDILGSEYEKILEEASEEDAFIREKEISKHRIMYCYNTANVRGNLFVGGIIGLGNSLIQEISNVFASCYVYGDSGTHAGGIVGCFNAGKINSAQFDGYVEVNGSINNYAGGIAGYLGGTLEGCYSNAVINAKSYMGGIAGYVTEKGSIKSCLSNSYILSKSTSRYLGNIAGFVEGLNEEESIYSKNLQYNYFLGFDLTDYSGINGINYGANSLYAASRVYYKDVVAKDLLSVVDSNFGNSTKGNYYTKDDEGKMPLLTNFITVDKLDDNIFDDSYNLYDDFETYFNKYKETYDENTKENSVLDVHVVYMEWNANVDKNDKDTYFINTIKSFEEDDFVGVIINPNFQYAQKVESKEVSSSEKYLTYRKDGQYKVHWGELKREFINQTVYAYYDKIVTSLYDSKYNIFVETDFKDNFTMEVIEEDSNYKILLYENGERVDKFNVIVRVKVNDPERYYVRVDNKTVDSSAFGEYLVFNLESTVKYFNIVRGPMRLELMQDYEIALIFGGPIILAIIVYLVIYNIKDAKKAKKQTTKKKKKKKK